MALKERSKSKIISGISCSGRPAAVLLDFGLFVIRVVISF